MGATFTGSSFDSAAFMAVLRAKMFEALNATMEQAVKDMKAFTEARGTAKSGHPGRVDTGAMLNAIDKEVFWAGIDTVVGKFGFVNAQELYYALQTSTGFTHWKSGEFIAPTFALQDAGIIAMAEIIGRLGAML